MGAVGSSALVVALCVALLGAVLAVAGARRARADYVRGAYAAVYTNFALLTIANVAMVFALVTHDFSVSYVAQVGSRSTPLLYTVISLWGALEGSILFWGWVLAAYAAVVVYRHRAREGALLPYAAATLLGVAVFFSILLVGPANPFGTVSPVPADGPGPNPLLQNHPLMAVHPPLLYLGYVGMTVPFAFAVGAMIAGEAGRRDEWLVLTKRWTLGAWTFLTAAIIAGMWWSYEVLGWGGYWAWDPVENASFMPWLTATAFLHSSIVQERRGLLRVWNLNLVVATFLLTVLGTFLTRSGVLSSVHAFTTGRIGYYFLWFIAVTLVFSLALVAGTSGERGEPGRLDAKASRETIFLLNNLVLTVFSFTVLVGTLFPLVAEALRGVKVSVGAPFFNRMTLPLCVALLFLLGVGPALPWRRATRDVVRRQLVPPSAAALVAAVAAIAFGARDPYAVLVYAFGAFAITANAREFWAGTSARMRAHGERPLVALGRLALSNRHRYGGYVAHIGVVVVAVAIAASSTGRVEREATLRPGETVTVGPFGLRLGRVWGAEEPQRFVIAATVDVLRDGRVIDELQPRLNFYRRSDQPIATPAVRSRAPGDLYLSLMAFRPDGESATVRVILEPLVPWIWAGGCLICLAALFAAWPSGESRAARAAARSGAEQYPPPLAVPSLPTAATVTSAREAAT
ncbi:MAG: heme lyase CcmF/NrfE family subunit [Gemmatimonadaceae bacterium]